MTKDELDQMAPEHDRESCSDAEPINPGVDLRYGHAWCRRCEGLWRIKAHAALTAQPAAPAVVADEWQPIETAPMDGTAVLVMRNDWPGCKNGVAEECNGHNTYVAQWWAGERDGRGAWICYMDSILDPECPVTPTHWMPLPPPPTQPKDPSNG